MKKNIRALSLFDGISCGQIALLRAGFIPSRYFASEIEPHAISITQKHFPSTVQLGSVKDVYAKNLGKIDLIMGGSPCQGFSLGGKKKAFNDERSALFFEYVRLVKECLAVNPSLKFLLENVNMKKEHLNVITQELGVEPIRINSALLSAQNRDRYYWTNIEGVQQPSDKSIHLKDIMENNTGMPFHATASSRGILESYINLSVEQRRKQFLENLSHITSKSAKTKILPCSLPTYDYPYAVAAMRGRYLPEVNPLTGKKKTQQYLESRFDGKSNALTTVAKDNMVVPLPLLAKIPAHLYIYRYLTVLESERLQTLPEHYTAGIPMTDRRKAIGNGWTVDVIAHILSYWKP